MRAARPRNPVRQGIWLPRGLTFAVSVRRGDRVLVLGGYPGIARSLLAAGARPTMVLGTDEAATPQSLDAPVVPVVDGALPSMPDAAVDHVLVPLLAPEFGSLVPGEAARLLRPGGTLFVGVSAKLHQPRNAAARTLRGAERALARSGFAVTQRYGVRQSLRQPRYLVPLDAPEAVRWFVESACLPRNTYDAVLTRLARLLPSRLAGLLLFPDYAFRAVRLDDGQRSP